MRIQEYIKEERHLPYFLKDFHDQKDFFKLLWQWQTKGGQIDELSNHNWISQHIFTIDILLKFFALMGYRLEKISSPKMEFADLHNEIKKLREETEESFRKLIEEGVRSGNKETDEQLTIAK